MELQHQKPVIAGSSEPFLRVEELASLLSLEPDTIRDWHRYPDFPCLHVPGGLRVRASEVLRWLERFNRREKEAS
jgi:hypothetical protein